MNYPQDLIDRINSATKYPSIETYHKLGDRGVPTEKIHVHFCDGEDIVITEKVDGANARIIMFGDNSMADPTFDGRYLIGSREEILTARGDLIFNPSQSIVQGLRPIAERIWDEELPIHKVYVFYGEIYGGQGITKASKFYSKDGSLIGFRLFDALEMDSSYFRELLKLPVEKISGWRQNGGQTFCSEARLKDFSEMFDVDLTPRIAVPRPPEDIANTHEWLKEVLSDGSRVLLGEAGKGKPEGVVIRTSDRSKIAKIRFEDYERRERLLNR